MAAAWRRNGIVWLALLAMIAISIAVAYLPLGRWGFSLDVSIYAFAALLVGSASMGLDRAPTLNRLAAAAGFVFVFVMFTITACDLYTRI